MPIRDILMGGSPAYERQQRHGMQRAQDFLNDAQGYLEPFEETGEEAMGDYQDFLQQGMHPQQLYDQIMSNYQMTPAAQEQMQQQTGAAEHAASSSGMLGSTPLMENIQQRAQNISSQDMQQYLQNVLGIRQNEMQGLQNLMGQGRQAAGQMSSQYANFAPYMLDAYGQLGQSKQQGYGSLSSGLGDLAGAGIGAAAGGLIGGPPGAMMGASMGLSSMQGSGGSQSGGGGGMSPAMYQALSNQYYGGAGAGAGAAAGAGVY